MKRRVVLIDADTPIYTAATASETSNPFTQPGAPVYDELGVYIGVQSGGPVILQFDEAKGRAIFDRVISNIQDATKADEVVLCLSNYEDPWRKVLMPWYKANRKNLRKPVGLKPLRAYAREQYRCFERPRLEGDDVCGILLTMPDAPFVGQRVLASADKDMRTLPGHHYHLRHRMEFEVTPTEADRFHMVQTLIGDTIDNYKGCPGIGEVKAEKLLEQGNNINEWWPLVKGAFQKAGLTEAYALLHAQVSRICHHTDWDFDKKEVIPWQPPKGISVPT